MTAALPELPAWAAKLGFTDREYASATAWADEQLAVAPELSPGQRDRLRSIFGAVPAQAPEGAV